MNCNIGFIGKNEVIRLKREILLEKKGYPSYFNQSIILIEGKEFECNFNVKESYPEQIANFPGGFRLAVRPCRDVVLDIIIGNGKKGVEFHKTLRDKLLDFKILKYGNSNVCMSTSIFYGCLLYNYEINYLGKREFQIRPSHWIRNYH